MANLAKKTKENKQILKKHVSAIHIGAKLTLLQRKLVNALLYNAYETLLTEKEHRINTRLLCEMIGFDSKNIAYLKDALKGLMETVVEFDVMEDDGERSWEAMVLLPYAKIKGGSCTYRYERALAEKLYHPDVYSKINLSVLREMNSSHALILYENCHRYLGSGQTAVWELDVFRKLMAIENRYKEFKFLKRDVIQPAIKEVNAVSNIQIDLRTIRKGRAVVAVQFTVAPSPQTALFGMAEEDDVTRSKAYEELCAEGISKTLARAWVTEHGEAYVMEKIGLTRNQDAHGKIKASRSGFLKAAIEGNFQNPEDLKRKERATQERIRDGKRRRENELAGLNEQYRGLERQYREYCVALIEEAFQALDAARQTDCAREFVETLKLPLARKEFNDRGWKSRVIFQDAKAFWVARSLPILSLAEYCAQEDMPDPKLLKQRVQELENAS